MSAEDSKPAVENAEPQEVTKEVKSNPESSKIIVSIISSLAVAVLAMVLISMELLSPVLLIFIIPLITYGISIVMSSIYQYSMCSKLNIGSIALSNLFILGTTGATSLFLFLERLPILRTVFGPYAPRNPLTGLPYSENTDEYKIAMENENHYKIQFFSSIVKAVMPLYWTESLKDGFVYFYWIFWMTLLPLFFLLSVQGICK